VTSGDRHGRGNVLIHTGAARSAGTGRLRLHRPSETARLRVLMPKEDDPAPPPLRHDLNLEVATGGYEIWCSDRIAEDHPDLVDRCADWLEDEAGVVNLGQIDHKSLLADGVLTDELKQDIVAWWAARVTDLDQG